MSGETATNGQLGTLLSRLGFDSRTIERRVPRSKRTQELVRFKHADSETLIILTRAKLDAPVPKSALLSARLHLIQKRLFTEAEFAESLQQRSIRETAR